MKVLKKTFVLFSFLCERLLLKENLPTDFKNATPTRCFSFANKWKLPAPPTSTSKSELDFPTRHCSSTLCSTHPGLSCTKWHQCFGLANSFAWSVPDQADVGWAWSAYVCMTESSSEHAGTWSSPTRRVAEYFQIEFLAFNQINETTSSSCYWQ